MANRKRPIQVKFRVTPDERELIDKRMKQVGSLNMAAYLRKMAIDGYVVKLELPELREMVSAAPVFFLSGGELISLLPA